MTNSTTEPTHSVRERLARALWDHDEIEVALHNDDGVVGVRLQPWDTQPKHFKAEYLRKVDAILAELQKPSEGTVEKGYVLIHDASEPFLEPDDVKEAWQAVLQYIRDGGS